MRSRKVQEGKSENRELVETGSLFTPGRAVEETDLRVEGLLGSKKEYCVGAMAVDIYKI